MCPHFLEKKGTGYFFAGKKMEKENGDCPYFPKGAIGRLTPYNARPVSLSKGTYIIKMDANESPFDLPPGIKRSIFNDLKKIGFNRYPDPDALELRKDFSKKIGLPLSWTAAGNGSDELILYISLVFAKRKILYSSPTFAMYRIIGISSGAAAKDIPLEAGFKLPLERILREKGADIIFISTPNNPTGNCFREEDILEIIKRKNSLVVLDEAYVEFCSDSFLPYLKKFENLVILRTFSKAFGLAGLRIGFMLAHPAIIREVNKVRLPYNLSLFSQTAGRIVLKNSHYLNSSLREIISERERVFKNLCSIPGICPYPSQANFILFHTSASSDKIWSYLARKGVFIRNLNGYGGLKNCLRVTIGTREENDFFLKKMRRYEKAKK